MYYFAGNIGEPVTAAVVEVGESFVIETQKVKDGGVQIVDTDGVFDGFVDQKRGQASFA